MSIPQAASAWFSATELAGIGGLPHCPKAIRRLAQQQAWRRRRRQGRGAGVEYHVDSLPAAAQDALVFQPELIYPPAERDTDAPANADREHLWAAFDQLPESARDVARRRLAALHSIEALEAAGSSRVEAVDAVAQQTGAGRATIYRWLSQARGIDRSDWLAALAPRHAGRPADTEIDAEAWDLFRADYLRPEAPGVAACYERLERAAAAHGWRVPSRRTMYRLIEQRIAWPVRTLARDGAKALERIYPAQERDRSVFHALQAVNADGHRFDVFCRWPDGTIARPMMLCWQDLASGKLLSYRVDQTEHKDLIRLAFGDLVERWGIPHAAYLDNGRGFASKWLTGGQPTRYRFKIKPEDPVGIITQVGVAVHWTTPYHGQAKPIERAFRDLCEYVAKHPAFSGAYCGNAPDAKPENYGSRAVPIEEFRKVLETEIAAHNARPGRRASVAQGRSFDAVFAESYARVPVRRATAAQRRLWMLAAEGVVASRVDGSVRLAGNRYWTEALATYADQRIIVRFDPDHLHESVHCYERDGREIGEAACIQTAGFNDTRAAREHSRARRTWMRAQREQLDAERRMTALEVAKRLPDGDMAPSPPPERKVVQARFKRKPCSSELPTDETREEAFGRAVDDQWARFIQEVKVL